MLTMNLAMQTSNSLAVIAGSNDREAIQDDSRGPSSRQPADPWKLLALNVVYQAILESREGNQEAERWLAVEGVYWLAACGADVDLDGWQAWVQKGCKGRATHKARKHTLLRQSAKAGAR